MAKNAEYHHHSKLLLQLALLIGSIFLVVLTVNEVKEGRYIGRPTAERDTISIQASGKVVAIPDIAVLRLSVVTERLDVTSAQEENTKSMNLLIAELEKLDIEKEDITTSNYSIYPQYDFSERVRTLRGYEVRNEVRVKVREIDDVGTVLASATRSGANQIGNLSFSIDDPDELEQQARNKALAKAKTKAEQIAKSAGVNLGKVVSFSESQAPVPGPVFRSLEAIGVGGGGGDVPSVEPGSQEVEISVTVSYEIY